MAAYSTNQPWNYRCIVAAVCAAFIQGASNIFNQLYDLEIDRINKPDRPIVSGQYTPLQAKVFVTLQTIAAFASFAYCGARGFMMLCAVAAGIIMYSVPPFKFKDGMYRSVTWLGFVREYIGHLTGWALMAPIFDGRVEPYLVALPFFIYMAGVISVKDLCDIEGDRHEGVHTIATEWGEDACAKIIRWFWFMPWILLAVITYMGYLKVNITLVLFWCALGVVWGLYVGQMVIAAPRALATGIFGFKFHPGFFHAYYLSMFMNWGLTLGYMLAPPHSA
jgi:4-hydroxybenzoate polyprenyltransferase